MLNDKWKSFITSHNSRPGKIYGNIKIHKTDIREGVITSGCNTPVDHLSIFVEKVLYGIASELPSRIKDTNHMLDIIDDLNNLNLHTESVLVSFDIINMFPSIDNKMGINSVKTFSDERACKDPPTQCVIEAFELCLSCNNLVFNNNNYIQTNSTAQGPHMPCSYCDIAMAGHDSKVLMYVFPPKVWKRFRDDVFIVWTHDTAKLPSFLDYLNNIDGTGKIKFTMQIADDVNGLEFLDLKIICLNGKLSVDVYSKPTNRFTYVMPSTCYPMKNINKVPQGIALRLQRICDTTEKYESRADEYKNYLLGCDYKPSLVDEEFKKIGQISREDARKSKPKTNQASKIKFVTKYNPKLPKIDRIIKKHISILHSDDALKTLFPKDCFSTIYKRNKNLKELIAPSIYPKKIKH